MEKLHSASVDRLFRAIRTLESEEDCYAERNHIHNSEFSAMCFDNFIDGNPILSEEKSSSYTIKLAKAVTGQVEIRLKYDGYIKRQLAEAARSAKLAEKNLPADLDYSSIKGLRLEAQQKLNEVKPLNIGQASRISGVSPADISVLLIYLGRS